MIEFWVVEKWVNDRTVLPECPLTGKKRFQARKNPGIRPQNSNLGLKSQDGGRHPGLFFVQTLLESASFRVKRAKTVLETARSGMIRGYSGIIRAKSGLFSAYHGMKGTYLRITASSPGSGRGSKPPGWLQPKDGGHHPAAIPAKNPPIPAQTPFFAA